ncbi:MAG: N-acetyltransferase [Chloroflexi bacterium HGW-Chloroflexi-10]|nr:MAG: N-acetyltransferase [Chloroflexi bacterium HGW-Chloroflexi-10]
MYNGEKTTLRALRRDDLETLCRFNNDVAVELAGGGDPPMPQSLERLQAEFDQEIAKGGRDGSSFAIEAGGKMIGHCGLFNFNEVAHTCELGITIGEPDYWGKGYGSDAVRVLLDYAFYMRNIRKVILTVHGNNPRAIRSYEKCGFHEEGRLVQQVWSNGEYVDLVYMGVFQAAWLNKNTK